MESRYDLFDLRIEYAEPVVPRSLRLGLPERMRHDGTVERPLDQSLARAGLRCLVEEHAIEALAVCLLHAYANPAHEHQVVAIAAEMYPDLPVTASADVAPVMREFERWTTTTVNAYAQPLADRPARGSPAIIR